jgi:LacI family transcriptional regulator
MLKAAGIKEIAQALEVSIGTVDRALHSRPGINPITRERVLKMAQTMGYRPNIAAQYLKSQRQLRISVHLPLGVASFFDAVRTGIRQAAAPLHPFVRVDFRSYPRLGEGDTEIFQQALREECNGFIIAPGNPAAVRLLIRKVSRVGVPVVCVATDAPGTERLTTVSADPLTNGAVVGELMCHVLREPGRLLCVTGSLSTQDHADKLRGFQTSLQAFGGYLQLGTVIEAHDHEGEAYRRAREALQEDEGIRGIYVSTSNSLPVLRAAQELGLSGRITVVTTDLFPALVPFIRSGQVLATIHQRPVTQGRRAFEALHQFLVEGKCPPARITLAPHIVMRSNLDLFLQRL